MKRRQFLNASAASVATAGTIGVAAPQDANALVSRPWIHRWIVPEIFARVPRPPKHSKALVIGSGFGGAISALRLAEQGIQTTVLERGMRWPTNTPWRRTFTTDAFPDGRAFWFKGFNFDMANIARVTDRFAGVLDINYHRNIRSFRAACMGGGSVVFSGVMLQPEQSDFEHVFKETVDYDELNNTYYPRVRKMLNLNTMPDDIYNSFFFAHSRSWDEASKKAGYDLKPCESIFNWDVVRDEMAGRRRQSAIIGETNFGNSNGAKFDLNQNYIQQAEATGNAKFYAGQQVESVAYKNGRYEVEVRVIRPTGPTDETYTLTADTLFMAAGSISSSELLVKARETGALPKLNEHVGEGWGANGDAIVVRSFSRVRGLLQSSPVPSRIYDTDGPGPVTLENWASPGVPVNIGVTVSLGIAVNDDRGRFVYDSTSGKVNLDWSAKTNKDVEDNVRRVHNKILDANGGVPGLRPIIRDVNAGFTAHPLGGVVLGKACDHYGRVKGYKGLYIMDGAMVPGSTGAVNPAFTISALAERNIERILRDDF